MVLFVDQRSTRLSIRSRHRWRKARDNLDFERAAILPAYLVDTCIEPELSDLPLAPKDELQVVPKAQLAFLERQTSGREDSSTSCSALA